MAARRPPRTGGGSVDPIDDLFAGLEVRTRIVCGVDEAGRGPLAGPVYAAAVILDPQRPIEGLADSKILSAKTRERLADRIRSEARAYAVAYASVREIDRLNILQASMLAMQRAVAELAVAFDEVWVDGNRLPRWPYLGRAIVGGDALVDAISAASILAKTARDRVMCFYAARFPQYGFERHKGYPTPEHFSALSDHGPCAIHRRSFAPVQQAVTQTDHAAVGRRPRSNG
jgi:ribonuclease HII